MWGHSFSSLFLSIFLSFPFFSFLFWSRVSLCSFICPGTYCVDQNDFDFTEIMLFLPAKHWSRTWATEPGKTHQAILDVFSLLWQNAWHKQREEGTVCFGRQLQRIWGMVTWPPVHGAIMCQKCVSEGLLHGRLEEKNMQEKIPRWCSPQESSPSDLLSSAWEQFLIHIHESIKGLIRAFVILIICGYSLKHTPRGVRH